MQNKYENNDEAKILVAKMKDKQRFCETKNKITYSDFLNENEKNIIQKNMNLDNFFFYGVNENADREILVFYPEKINEELARKNLKDIIAIIRINLPNDMKGKFEHRNYLSALMKIGLERERIGDILVDDNGADIITFESNKNYIIQSLSELTRFRKSKIELINIDQIRKKEDKFENTTIIVSSMRVDNIIAELAKCSRNKAEELIESERVYINYEAICKNSKIVNVGDVVTIRGKGKFIIDGLVRNTRGERLVLEVRKYA